jgi:F1F0 ATPase subunit 2
VNPLLSAVLAWLVGVFLGVVFYGGLWWTIRVSLSSQCPGFLFLGSMLLRMGLTLIGFYLVVGEGWQRLLLCLLGFAMARAGVTWLTQSAPAPEPHRMREDHHAP